MSGSIGDSTTLPTHGDSTTLPPLSSVNVLFTSSNPDKVGFWKRCFAEEGIPVEILNIPVTEIEDDDWQKVIEDKTSKVLQCLEARGISGTIAISEDAIIEGGSYKYPGTGTKKTIRAFKGKLNELFKLMGCPECEFRCSVGLTFPSGEPEFITATTKGSFVEKRSKEDGCNNVGLINTQFVPSDDPKGRTISQMSWEDEKRYNPRGKVIAMTLEALRKNYSF